MPPGVRAASSPRPAGGLLARPPEPTGVCFSASVCGCFLPESLWRAGVRVSPSTQLPFLPHGLSGGWRFSQPLGMYKQLDPRAAWKLRSVFSFLRKSIR